MQHRIRALAGLAVLLLTACQQHADRRPPAQQQINQLAALVAAGDWARDNCNRPDIPSHERLIQGALDQGEAKGWQTAEIPPATLATAIQQRFTALNNANGATQCATLGQALQPFLAQVRTK